MGCFLSKTSTDSRDDRSNLPAPLPHQSIDPIESSSSSDKKNPSHAPAHLSHHSPFLDPIESSLSSYEENQIHAPAQSLVIDPIESSSSSDEEENQSHAPASENAEIHKMKEYGFKELAEATDYFSNNCLLGEGGFGQVFKAILDGEVVAIKKLKKIKLEDKLEEGEYLSCVKHPNIVKMIGHCTQGADRLLVLEFVPNNTLTDHLHEKNKILEWPTRMKIAINSAKGLLYLHQGRPKIIHRDIKADNILLDDDFEPKVADFSLANFLPNTGNVNHITSILRGTNVYADPEYGDIQRVSEKSDVYSFGVVLLELITGRKSLDKQGDTIINWAKDRIGQALDNNEYANLIDSRLQEYNEEEMIRMICCAAASVYKPSHFRPIMKQIIKVLEGTMPHVKIMNWKDIETLQGRATTDLESVLGVERIQITPQKIFAYKELAMATGGFSNVNLLGEGGFGQVYKGTLSNGEVVAIKKLSLSSKQGEIEFLMEVGTLNRAHHQHLVKLIGYCVDRANRLLIYEFVPNNSLGNNLHGQDKVIINWPTRMKIAIGSAKGLAYLHEICNPKIIHRGINASNILLDHNFEPKISDFGIAKEFSNSSVTHMSTVVKGTFGYICPDYYLTQRLSDKTDVYSFGVVLLELITGKTPILREGNVASAGLTSWVRAQLKEVLDTDNYNNIVDVKLKNNYKKIEMIRMIHCAAACVYKPVKYRPKMSQIVEVLQGKLASESIWLSSDNTFLKDNYQLH
ncbi:probable LRR receptor-like serine/threonine-protein kinase At1g51820 isoform X3 [Hevea brasiliensis]|uniref:probable LRR receptor-like serine/threonine-protein kinase At1g51820 isoform X3 n=1 Tax=Hevea brasiliensis TaxID=3981 RepID=UPI0025E6B564|nr:probable LRR receptor-like serine/threonine-protein kinase At1g51820 isoform X3 [Hevea brasiliensis]